MTIQVIRVVPGSGWRTGSGQIWATMRTEVVMQWRRWGLWLAFAFATVLVMLIFAGNIGALKHPAPHSVYVSLHFTSRDFVNLLTFATAHYGDLIFGIVAALLIADRMERDRRLGMLELQRATDQGTARYVLGKFLGNYVAVLLPTFLGYLLCALFLVIIGMPAVFLQTTLLAFLLIFVPVYAAIVGVTLLLASFLPTRIVQVGFPLLWLYSNLNPLGWYTLKDTIFNPDGQYIYPIFFPTPITRLYGSETSLQLALLNIAVLFLTAIVALFFTCGSLVLQRRERKGHRLLSRERTARNSASPLGYAPVLVKQRLSVREAMLLARYHLRLLNWWLFCLMLLGFLGSCALLWLELRPGGPLSLAHASGLSQFVMESGAGLVAGMLTSSLIVGDPMLEVTMATRAGLYRVLVWRYLLTICILLLCSTAYLAWSLWSGVSYAAQQSALFILLVWLAPVLVMSMLGLLGSLVTRNAALGTVIAAIPLMAALFMHDELLTIPAVHPLFIPYTYWGHDAPDWWANRLVLLVVALALAAWSWYWLRREERLLGNLH